MTGKANDLPVLRNRYVLVSNLGHGSFATVYLARDTAQRGMLVAVKAISTEGFSPEEYRDLNSSFLQEAAFLMQLNHKGLPSIVEFFAEGAFYYIVMEWVAGKTMKQAVQEEGEVPQERVIDWGIQLADIMVYLHSIKPYPVLLGDLKPSNVMITYDNEVKIIDFGVARYLSPVRNPRTFAMVSPGFAPPEKYTRFDCDLRGDIYSFGATLYWALTQADLARMRFDIPLLRELRPEADHWLESTLAKCLRYDASGRYRTIEEVRDELVALRKEIEGRKQRARKASGNLLGELYRNKADDDF
ncbi:MAG: serine/threonine-protein kinase [bacterium]|nr:serine/threonine-protein kinase [bacterium]